jgi:hypothetical protein
MSDEQHRHKGLMKGTSMRLHPVSQVHKDAKVAKWHNEELKVSEQDNDTYEEHEYGEDSETTEQPTTSNEGYIMIDLTDKEKYATGVRVKFYSKHKGKRALVGLEIKNN